MEKVLANRPEIARVASVVAPPRRSWAVVGSGPDHIAAAEVRIKLSELCYKAIALDSIEDKKHIDLSAEPMVIVCAPSVVGPNARDIAKEIDIFRAHKAAPVVVAAEGSEELFNAGVDVLSVPRCHPELAFVLAAMTGHLFGYEAALAIDAQALPFREARALLETVTRETGTRETGTRESGTRESGTREAGTGGTGTREAGAREAGPREAGAREAGGGYGLDELAPALQSITAPAVAGLRSGAYDGHLNASTAARRDISAPLCHRRPTS